MNRKAETCRSCSESGQAMVEYGLIIGVIVIVIAVVIAGGMGVSVFELYQQILSEASSVT